MSEHPSIADFVAASRAAQGLPPKVDDPATIARVAAIVKASRRTSLRGAA